MPWQYQQSTGKLSHNGDFVAAGYSGHGAGLNNPLAQDQEGVGPIPRGIYTIGAPKTPIDILGPIAMPLIPAATNQMFGRSAFFMHGDNINMDHTASDGCIIMSRQARALVDMQTDRMLVVVE